MRQTFASTPFGMTARSEAVIVRVLTGGKSMLKVAFLLTPILLMHGVSQAQGSAEVKRQLAECHRSKMAELRVESPFSVHGDVTCPPGDIVGFPPRCRTDDRSTPVIYDAPEGYRIKNASVQENSRTSRTGVDGFQYTSRRASVTLSCNGHGCGGEGRVWVDVNLVGTIERIPTEAESKRAMDQCIDQVLR